MFLLHRPCFGLRCGGTHGTRRRLRLNTLGAVGGVGAVFAFILGAQSHRLLLGTGQGLRLLRLLWVEFLGNRLLHNRLLHGLWCGRLFNGGLRLLCFRRFGADSMVRVDLPPLHRLHGALNAAACILGCLLLRKAASFFVLIL